MIAAAKRINVLFNQSGADFSSCRTWRYALWRHWSAGPWIAFIGLNPSTADETENDPTVRRCIGFAKSWGYGGLLMLNAYGYRATVPADMKAVDDPVGPGHDRKLRRYRGRASAFIAAWGVHCEPLRAQRVCRVIGRRIDCLGMTKGGSPRHPLYLTASSERRAYWSPAG